MAVAMVAVTSPTAGWLRSPGFDSSLILGSAALALLCGLAVGLDARLFDAILPPYLWLLSYPHLISTYTRTWFDAESPRQWRWLNVELLVLIFVAVALIVVFVGAWLVVSAYFYWQWFHITRQSYGIARCFARKGGAADDENLTTLLVYAVPIWGVLYRSYQSPATYLGAPMWAVPTPVEIVVLVGTATSVLLVYWLVERGILLARGRASLAHSFYMLTHFAVFAVAYLVLPDINQGWIVLSIWHSLQYILFVWASNNRRFKDQVDPARPLLSTLSQSSWAVRYYLAIFLASTALFAMLRFGMGWFEASATSLAVIVYKSINYHHYVVDAIIWRAKRKPA